MKHVKAYRGITSGISIYLSVYGKRRLIMPVFAIVLFCNYKAPEETIHANLTPWHTQTSSLPKGPLPSLPWIIEAHGCGVEYLRIVVGIDSLLKYK